MDSPPLVSEWVPNKQLIEVYEVVAQLRGLDGVAAVAKGATDTMNRISQPLFSGLLRLFGTSPSTLLSRMNILVRPVSRGGAQYAYREIERGLGEMIVTFPIRDEAKPCTYKTLEASLEVVAQMCAPKASVALKSVKTDVDPIQAIYEVRW